MSKKWTAEEEAFLKEQFVSLPWSDILTQLSDKTEEQILKKAHKLGLKRKNDLIEVVYDDEKEAWVEKRVHYGPNGLTNINTIFQVPKDVSYEEVQKRWSEKASQHFFDLIVKPDYVKFLQSLKMDHHDEIYSVFFEMKKEMFALSSSDKEKRKELSDYYGEKLKEVVLKVHRQQKEDKKKC